VANGKTVGEIIQDYPYLESEDIQQSLLYAAWLAITSGFSFLSWVRKPDEIKNRYGYLLDFGQNYHWSRMMEQSTKNKIF
jgi:hypothetical protein